MRASRLHGRGRARLAGRGLRQFFQPRHQRHDPAEVYDINSNQITGAAFMGVVVMRNTNTGGMVIYDISNNQVASAFFIGAVGLDWQLGGIAADRGRRTMDQSAAGAMGRLDRAARASDGGFWWRQRRS